MFSFKDYRDSLISESDAINPNTPEPELENYNIILGHILNTLSQMSHDDIDEFGFWLYTMFFGDAEDEDAQDYFYLVDVLGMILALDPEFYPDVQTALMYDEGSDDEAPNIVPGVSVTGTEIDGKIVSESTPEDSELEEAVSGIFKPTNRNRKKRKFYANQVTKADLRRTAAQRRRENRKNRPKRHRRYIANKNKVLRYNKQYRAAVNKGVHIKKIRKKA